MKLSIKYIAIISACLVVLVVILIFIFKPEHQIPPELTEQQIIDEFYSKRIPGDTPIFSLGYSTKYNAQLGLTSEGRIIMTDEDGDSTYIIHPISLKMKSLPGMPVSIDKSKTLLVIKNGPLFEIWNIVELRKLGEIQTNFKRISDAVFSPDKQSIALIYSNTFLGGKMEIWLWKKSECLFEGEISFGDGPYQLSDDGKLLCNQTIKNLITDKFYYDIVKHDFVTLTDKQYRERFSLSLPFNRDETAVLTIVNKTRNEDNFVESMTFTKFGDFSPDSSYVFFCEIDKFTDPPFNRNRINKLIVYDAKNGFPLYEQISDNTYQEFSKNGEFILTRQPSGVTIYSGYDFSALQQLYSQNPAQFKPKGPNESEESYKTQLDYVWSFVRPVYKNRVN